MSRVSAQKLIYLVGLLPAAMLFLAVAELPYGYYTLLRLVVTASSLLLVGVELLSLRDRTSF